MQKEAMMNTPLNFREKEEAIENILSEDEIDLWALRELCLSEGGLLNDSFRKDIWPMLLGIDVMQDADEVLEQIAKQKAQYNRIFDGVDVMDSSSIESKGSQKQVIARCLDAKQIELDIARCTWHLLTGSQRSRRRQMRNKHKKKISVLLKRKQRRLGNLVNLVLIQSYANNINDLEDTRLRYYQGYHDISCIFLNTLGGVMNPYTRLNEENKNGTYSSDSSFHDAVTASKTAKAMGLDLPSKLLLQISQAHLSDFMKNNFEALTTCLRLIVMPLIAQFDREVHDYLEMCEMEPFFCLSWIITWFSHDIRDTSLVKRLFDVFIVSHPLMPVYMSIAMVLHPVNREEILNTDCDFASVHKILRQLPRNSCSVGWIFIGNDYGGDYVSGDEESEKQVSVATESMFTDDIDVENNQGDDGSLATSLSGSVYSGVDSSRVPFQELIDLAVKFMRRIPPRNLSRLAYKYHGKDSQIFAKASSINLLQDPPDWALRASIHSIKRSNRKQEYNDPDLLYKSKDLVAEKAYPRAAIACGMGPDGELESKKRFWRHKKLQISATIVGLAAVTFGLLIDKSILSFSSRVSFNDINKDIEDSIVKLTGFEQSRPNDNVKSSDDYRMDVEVDVPILEFKDDFSESCTSDEVNYVSEVDISSVSSTETMELNYQCSTKKDSKNRLVQIMKEVKETVKGQLANEAEIVLL